MALVVETGAGVAGANSYTSLADAQAFIDARGFTVTLTEGSLLRAMDELQAADLSGVKADQSNPLPCPRVGMTDCDGYEIASDTIPAGVIAAQIWLAFYIEQGNDPSAIATPAIKSETVDVIEVEYAVDTGDTTAVSLMDFPNVKNALRCLIADGIDGAVTGVLRRA